MSTQASQKAKMLAGELYLADGPELALADLQAQTILARFDATSADADAERRAWLTELFARFGEGSILKPTLRCDYGFNIAIGVRPFVNYDASCWIETASPLTMRCKSHLASTSIRQPIPSRRRGIVPP